MSTCTTRRVQTAADNCAVGTQQGTVSASAVSPSPKTNPGSCKRIYEHPVLITGKPPTEAVQRRERIRTYTGKKKEEQEKPSKGEKSGQKM